MARTREQGAGVSTSIAVRTLSGGQQFPRSPGILPLLPLEVAGKQVERVNFRRMSPGTGLNFGLNLLLNLGTVRAPEA